MLDKRKTKFPFNQDTANTICEAIASGGRLTKLPRKFPSYNVICRWRRNNHAFNLMILYAYEDRKDFIIEQLISAGLERNRKVACSLSRELTRQVGVHYPQNLKIKRDKRREYCLIDTGINKILNRSGQLIKVE